MAVTVLTQSSPIIGISIDAGHALRLLSDPDARDASLATPHADFVLIREHLSDENDTDVQAQLVAAFLAGRVADIGIVPEVDVFRSDPYLVTRSLASLDILSHGRAGYAPSSRSRGNLDIGYDPVGDDASFVQEFVEAVDKLWNNWQPGALARDWSANRYVDGRLIRRADHKGHYFSIRGPLPTPTAVQNAPVLIAHATPLHRAVLSRAAAVITIEGESDKTPKAVVERSLRHPLNGGNRNPASIIFLADNEIETWSELVELSRNAASGLGWQASKHPRTLEESLSAALAAQQSGVLHV
jgi:alkanesulfonate monooxygenase SsuD/methylene tetrahydromethanopterin reductase-like flavin-dependent oxidoreductase (luciferase family)